MKFKILTFLFLLTIFCVTPDFAQSNSSSEEKLVTLFVKVEYLYFTSNITSTPPYKTCHHCVKPPTEEQRKAFDLMFRSLLTEKGTIEIDFRSFTFVVTDKENRAEFFKKFVTILDKSGLRENAAIPIEYFVSEFAEEDKKLITEKVGYHILPTAPYCDVGEELYYARLDYKHNLLIKIIEGIKVQVKIVQGKTDAFSFFNNELELTGTEKRVGLAKKIVDLFHQAAFD